MLGLVRFFDRNAINKVFVFIPPFLFYPFPDFLSPSRTLGGSLWRHSVLVVSSQLRSPSLGSVGLATVMIMLLDSIYKLLSY